MKTKKLLSILLALMMMLSVVPMYASAAAEALSASNVTQWPTYNYKNGQETVFFGQTFDEALAINDDEIVLDSAGEQVAGHFEFKNPAGIPTSATSAKATIVFVPDDASKYEGFSKSRSVVVYSVQKTTPVYIDEVNDPVVATKVEAGATLSTSILSGGKMTNPYNENEPILLARSWEWADPNTIVNESGYFYAIFYPANYNQVTAQVYVDIAVDIIESEISTIPSIPELTYDGITTWNDITLSGGIAVEKDTTNVVEGTFAITDSWKWQVIEAGTYEIDVTFTPNDTEAYTKVEFKIPVTVNPAFIKFVDENGDEIVPEITVPYGTKLTDGNMKYYISQAGCTAVAGNDGCWYDGTDADGYIFGTSASGEAPEVGTHYYEFIARPYTTVGVTSNYAETVLKLKVTVIPVEAEMKLDTTPIKGTDGLELWVWNKDTSSAARPEGTFTVYLDGAVYKDNVKYGEHFTWQPTESKTYEFKATYTPTENDPFTIADFTMSRDIKLTRKLTASENILKGYGDFKYGTAVEINANVASDNFAGWKITDAQGNEVTLDGVDNSSTKITITMPDYDINVEALEKNATSGGSGGIDDIFGGLDMDELTQGDSEWVIINIIRNIIAKFKSFLQQLIETFQSIGD